MVDAVDAWNEALDRFADLLDRIEDAVDDGDWDDPGLSAEVASTELPEMPADAELRRRASALQEEGDRLAQLVASRRDEVSAELSSGGDRRIAARQYRRAERLA